MEMEERMARDREIGLNGGTGKMVREGIVGTR